MATYTVASDAHHTLGASVVDTVTLTGDFAGALIINDTGTNAIYVTYSVSGTAPADPTVGGDNTVEIPASAGAFVKIGWGAATGGIVKLISSGAMAYSVEGF